MKRLLSSIVVGFLVVGVGGLASAQDVLEWPGHLMFRPFDPTLRFNGGLIFRNRVNANENFKFGTATSQAPHFETKGQATPTLQACGTTPVIGTSANDTTGTITTGSGTAGVACAVVFAVPWTNAPYCTANNMTRANAVRAHYRNATSVEFSGLTASDEFVYHCIGRF